MTHVLVFQVEIAAFLGAKVEIGIANVLNFRHKTLSDLV